MTYQHILVQKVRIFFSIHPDQTYSTTCASEMQKQTTAFILCFRPDEPRGRIGPNFGILDGTRASLVPALRFQQNRLRGVAVPKG